MLISNALMLRLAVPIVGKCTEMIRCRVILFPSDATNSEGNVLFDGLSVFLYKANL